MTDAASTDNELKALTLDPANRDYAKYLEWLAEGNLPLSADETPE